MILVSIESARDFLLVVTLVLSCSVSALYGDLLAENCVLFLPLSHDLIIWRPIPYVPFGILW